MKPIKRLFYLLFALCNFTALAVEYHVSPNGNDAAKGLADSPFRTINHSAQPCLPPNDKQAFRSFSK